MDRIQGTLPFHYLMASAGPSSLKERLHDTFAQNTRIFAEMAMIAALVFLLAGFFIVYRYTLNGKAESLREQGGRLGDVLEGPSRHMGMEHSDRENHLNERWAEIVSYTLDKLGPISIIMQRLCHPDDLKRCTTLDREAPSVNYFITRRMPDEARGRSLDMGSDRGHIFTFSEVANRS